MFKVGDRVRVRCNSNYVLSSVGTITRITTGSNPNRFVYHVEMIGTQDFNGCRPFTIYESSRYLEPVKE